MPLQERIKAILSSLNMGLIEREEVMNLTFLSALAGESIFFLGPPGVAKSLIARRLKFAFKDAKSFEYLMHRFSTPDEVFGPISIKKLKNDDKLERVLEYYLPGANVAFLDEIWKAGPSIQNTLLTILNEKVFRNGEQQIDVDLFGIIAASNELPEENQGLDALWDRFLIRFLVKGIENRDNFEKMITATQNLYEDTLSEDIKISKAEYHQWQIERNNTEVPPEILNLINQIRIKIELYNKEQNERDQVIKPLYISDRRWKKIVNVLRTSAFLNDCKKIDLMDCFLIPFMIWDIPEQIDIIILLVKDCIRYQGYTIVLNIESIQKEIEGLSNEIETETQYVKKKSFNIPKIFDKKYYKILSFSSSYCYILINDFDTLPKKGDHNYINLYESGYRYNQGFYNINKVGKLSISYNQKKYSLEVEKKVKEEILTKKPHDLLINDWDKRIDNIKSEIQKELDKIEEYVKTDLKELKKNLFVDPIKSEIILNKIEELKIQLNQLDVRCNELFEKYHNLKENEVIEEPIQEDKNAQLDDEALILKFKSIMNKSVEEFEKDDIFSILELFKRGVTKVKNEGSLEEIDHTNQIIITDKNLKFWIRINKGDFIYEVGKAKDPDLTFRCDMPIFAGILLGELDFESTLDDGDISIDEVDNIDEIDVTDDDFYLFNMLIKFREILK